MTDAATHTLFDVALKKVIDTVGATGAAVYLGDPDRPLLRLAAGQGSRAADDAPWPVEFPSMVAFSSVNPPLMNNPPPFPPDPPVPSAFAPAAVEFPVTVLLSMSGDAAPLLT